MFIFICLILLDFIHNIESALRVINCRVMFIVMFIFGAQMMKVVIFLSGSSQGNTTG